MKAGLGLLFMLALLIALTEFAVWRECSALPSAAYCTQRTAR